MHRFRLTLTLLCLFAGFAFDNFDEFGRRLEASLIKQAELLNQGSRSYNSETGTYESIDGLLIDTALLSP